MTSPNYVKSKEAIHNIPPRSREEGRLTAQGGLSALWREVDSRGSCLLPTPQCSPAQPFRSPGTGHTARGYSALVIPCGEGTKIRRWTHSCNLVLEHRLKPQLSLRKAAPWDRPILMQEMCYHNRSGYERFLLRWRESGCCSLAPD